MYTELLEYKIIYNILHILLWIFFTNKKNSSTE
jgi:hypothetical protein